MSRRGRATWVIAVVLGISAALLADPVAGTWIHASEVVVPADGRLNTPDFNAKVTAVSWPERNGAQEPTPGRRFVRFTLEVTAPGPRVLTW